MKKTLALILALAMSLSLAACGGKNTASADTNSGDSSSTADDGVKTITIGGLRPAVLRSRKQRQRCF